MGCAGGCNPPNGHCFNGTCFCKPGFGGDSCDQLICPGNCSNSGSCINGQCACASGFTGHDCSLHTCPNECNQRGFCHDGKCECMDGFSGDDCGVEQDKPGSCSIHCVRSCLKVCSQVYHTKGLTPSKDCYVNCTRKCLPRCLTHE